MKLEELWLEYQSALRAFLLKRVADPDDVEDLLQEVLIKTHQSLSEIRSATSVKSWLFQVANRAMIDFYRHKAKANALLDEKLWFEQDEMSIQQEFSTCVAPFVSALPEEHAELLTAIDLQGESQKDYANKQGVSYSTLKSRVQKSRKLLKDIFEDCCHFSVDKQGNVIDYQPKNGKCDGC